MNPSAVPPFDTSLADTADDEDLAQQARAGHGIPSQDPDPSAQVALQPQEAQREARSALTGGGVVAGIATGAAIGAVVAGPVGVLVGVTLGAAAGALGSAVAGASAPPADASRAEALSADAVRLHIDDSDRPCC
jgi:non-heme chloroperoxidase